MLKVSQKNIIQWKCMKVTISLFKSLKEVDFKFIFNTN